MNIQIQHLPASSKYISKHYLYPIDDILFVIVLYNTPLSESKTFNTLKSAVQLTYPDTYIDLFICDNSFESQQCLTEKHVNIYYLHDESNPGVSASYNRAAVFARSKQKKWILIFDQDTELQLDSIKKYITALTIWPEYPLYAPQIINNGLLLSPCKYKFYRGSHFKMISIGVHTLEQKNVLNSGLLIDLNAFEKVNGYDEEVWLYFSDFVFFNKLKKYFKEFIVLDCKLEHDLSSSDYTDTIFALKRFKYYCEGAKVASKLEGNIGAYVSYGLTLGLRSIKMCMRFKKVEFIKVYINTFLISSL